MSDPPKRDTPEHHEVFHRFPCWEGFAPEGFRVNFLGVKTRAGDWLTGEPAPGGYQKTAYPSFDEEYFEWLDLLHTVTLAKHHFTMLELGAGWGRWLANAAFALQQSSRLPYRLVGVEAEPTHFAWMEEHLRENGVDVGRCRLIQAAVTDRDGEVGFHTGNPAGWYGQSIGGPTRVRAVSLATLLEPLERVDLIDLDLQGVELRALRAGAAPLNEKVKCVHTGTHSSKIEAGLRSLFRRLGWENLHDFPAGQSARTAWGTIHFADGVQAWLNPRLLSPEDLTAVNRWRSSSDAMRLTASQSQQNRLRDRLGPAGSLACKVYRSLVRRWRG